MDWGSDSREDGLVEVAKPDNLFQNSSKRIISMCLSSLQHSAQATIRQACGLQHLQACHFPLQKVTMHFADIDLFYFF